MATSSQSNEFDPAEFARSAKTNAKRLADLYVSERPQMRFARSLPEALQWEQAKIKELRTAYPDVFYKVPFLSDQFFQDYDHFEIHQKIPERYFVRDPDNYYFISHRWNTPEAPDPANIQFAAIKDFYLRLKPAVQNSYGFWYDYSCVPQRNAAGVRSPADEARFQELLQVMHLLPVFSSNVNLFTDTYLSRSWCCVEWIAATKISPLPLGEGAIIPFRNDIKFRQIAVLVWFLMADMENRDKFAKGDDSAATPYLNTLLGMTFEPTEATFASDKTFLQITLQRHFWYHVRLVGLRTQFMIACLSMDRFDYAEWERMFQTFLVISGDPDLYWLARPTFDLDTEALNLGDPFNQLRFHKGQIQVRSRSRTERLPNPPPEQ